MKVKIFTDTSGQVLENKINNWIEENPDFIIIMMSHAISGGVLSVLINYS